MPAAPRPHLFFALLTLTAATTFAAPEFVAVQSGPDGTTVGLRLAPDEKVRWLPLGAHAGDYTVSSYDAEKETVTLRRTDSTTLALTLKSAATQPAPLTIASFDYLRDARDQAKRNLYREAAVQDSITKKTRTRLAEAEAHGGVDNSTLANLREALLKQEANVARLLALLQEATKPTSPPKS